MKTYADMTNEQLITETHRLASSLSYYNAAEGNWSRERDAREACQRDFYAAYAEMKSRNIEFENKGYLL